VSESKGKDSTAENSEGALVLRGDKQAQPFHITPIDHSYILPDYRDTSDVRFEWLYWGQTAERFSEVRNQCCITFFLNYCF
jgi:hypothetical protein